MFIPHLLFITLKLHHYLIPLFNHPINKNPYFCWLNYKNHNYKKFGVVIYICIFIAILSIIVYILHMSQTYQPNKRKRAKTHGFLVRAKTPGGKKVTQARRQKGRAKVSIAK